MHDRALDKLCYRCIPGVEQSGHTLRSGAGRWTRTGEKPAVPPLSLTRVRRQREGGNGKQVEPAAVRRVCRRPRAEPGCLSLCRCPTLHALPGGALLGGLSPTVATRLGNCHGPSVPLLQNGPVSKVAEVVLWLTTRRRSSGCCRVPWALLIGLF